MKKTCVICGKEGYSYFPFCYEHLQMKSEGKIVKCPDCGAWHFADEACKCQKKVYTELPTDGFDTCVSCGKSTKGYAFCRKCYSKYSTEEMLDILNGKAVADKTQEKEEEKPQFKTNEYGRKVPVLPNIDVPAKEEQKTKTATAPETKKDDVDNSSDNNPTESGEEQNSVVVIDNGDKAKCITCGRQTGGMLFCPSCYRKYKNKELTFVIRHCTEVELVDASYGGKNGCKDGHKVKSKSEVLIDNYLFDSGIPHAYEHALPYGATEKEVLHPDFYLPNYLGMGKDVYIEHWGFNENNIQYQETKKFKMPIYKKLGITLICTYEKEIGEIYSTLDRKLNKAFIREGEINFDDSPSTSIQKKPAAKALKDD